MSNPVSDPRRIVEEAVTTLMRGDVASHLRLVADDVIAQFNENPPVHGKAAYRRVLDLAQRGEAIAGFQIVEERIEPDGAVTIRVNQEQEIHWQDEHGRRLHRQEVVPSVYTVRDGTISRVEMTLLGGPNRAYRFPQ